MKKEAAFFLSFLNFGKGKLKWFMGIFLIIGVLYGVSYVYEELSRLPPEEVVRQSLDKTFNARSYRFQVTANRVLEDKESVISDIYGEKCLEGIHLQGSVPLIKAEVEMYHLGEKIYRKDALTEGWVVVPEGGRVASEQLITELNPLGAFNFREDNYEARYTGKEKVSGKKCLRYEVMTKGENKYLELFWQDFNYIIWVDKKEKLIRRAYVTAEHRDNSQHQLNINITLRDFNVPIELKVPAE